MGRICSWELVFWSSYTSHRSYWSYNSYAFWVRERLRQLSPGKCPLGLSWACLLLYKMPKGMAVRRSLPQATNALAVAVEHLQALPMFELCLLVKGTSVMAIRLQSSDFDEGGVLPVTYTCDGDNTSPALSWEGVPAGTKSLVIIAEDPDAPHGNWAHWVVYDIPPDVRTFPGGVAPAKAMEDGTRQGTNDYKTIGYGGPCPTPGRPHRYVFHIYALRKRLNLPPGANRDQVENAMTGWILDEGQTMASYTRRVS